MTGDSFGLEVDGAYYITGRGHVLAGTVLSGWPRRGDTLVIGGSLEVYCSDVEYWMQLDKPSKKVGLVVRSINPDFDGDSILATEPGTIVEKKHGVVAQPG